jgi:threonine aldolase
VRAPLPGIAVDMRSDTITFPTEEMREAMKRAEVGDDCFGEDPSVCRLQELAAERLGTEAALFVPTGTMGNLCALICHAQPGQDVVLEQFCHILRAESGGYANVAGLAARPVATEFGILTPEVLEAEIERYGAEKLGLVCIENTHNYSGGSAWLPSEVEALANVVRKYGTRLHVDGARIFNAAIAAGADVKEYTRHVDSVTFCVSKGLSAPVGSVLCGTRSFIDKAHAARKRLGGGMRQSGVLAAAGIVALESTVERLAEDHARAAVLLEGLDAIEGVKTIRPPVPTNIVVVDVAQMKWTTDELLEKWAAHSIRAVPRRPNRARLVANRHTTDEQVAYVIDVTQQLARAA